MRIERALKIQREAKTRLADLWNRAEIFGLSNAQMIEERREILSAKPLSKAPAWVHSYLEGYWEARNEFAYRNHLVFGCFKDGKFLSTHRNRSDYYEKQGYSPCAFSKLDDSTRGHYWARNLRPFFVSSQEERG